MKNQQKEWRKPKRLWTFLFLVFDFLCLSIKTPIIRKRCRGFIFFEPYWPLCLNAQYNQYISNDAYFFLLIFYWHALLSRRSLEIIFRIFFLVVVFLTLGTIFVKERACSISKLSCKTKENYHTQRLWIAGLQSIWISLTIDTGNCPSAKVFKWIYLAVFKIPDLFVQKTSNIMPILRIIHS